MANFTNPIKAAFGETLHRFHQQLIADTPAMAEFVERPFSQAAVWAPGRMVDQVMEMLESWRKNDTSGAPRATPFLPVMIAAMEKGYTPAPPDFTRPAADPVDVMIPGDPKQRVFKMRVATADVRTQVAICAAEDITARSIGLQLALFFQAISSRRFYASFPLAGMPTLWPCVFEMPEIISVNQPNDQKNLTIYAADLTLRASVPLLSYPRTGSPEADGQGTGTADDPDGYLTTREVLVTRSGDHDPAAEIPAGYPLDRITIAGG